MEERLEKLEELIKDEDKIVTVTSYALITNVSLDESQKTINKYAEIHQGSKDIYLTYIINGIKKDTAKFSVLQVSSKSLEEEKLLFKPGYSLMIFSIQKGKHIDYKVIGLVEPRLDSEKNIASGVIVGKNCVKRVLRKNVLPTLPTPTIKGKSSMFMKQSSSVKSEPKIKDEEKTATNQEANKNKGNAQGSLASMFNKAAQNKKTDVKIQQSAVQKSKPKNAGLSNFVTKQTSKEIKTESEKNKENKIDLDERNGKTGTNSKNNLDIKKEDKNDTDVKKENKKSGVFDSDTDDEILKDLNIEQEKPVKKENKKSDLFDSDTDDEILKDLNIEQEKPVEVKAEKKTEVKTNRSKNKSSQKQKRAKADVGNDKSAKKRKRIIVEDSDSDDIFGSEKSDDEDIIEKSDEEEKPSKMEPKQLPPKNKRRKAVKKTYEDDEGFIVTQTEYVYETASEEEDKPETKIAKKEIPKEPTLKKKSSNNSETEISPNKAAKNKKGAKKVPSGNQPTLMNFFKKK